jgi:hypothetical protein
MTVLLWPKLPKEKRSRVFRFQLIPQEEYSDERADNVILEYVFDRIHTDIRVDDELLDTCRRGPVWKERL